MDLASLLLAFALLLVVAAIVLRPLLVAPGYSSAAEESADDRPEIEALIARREGILAALIDLDFDYTTDKIGSVDYNAQRPHLVAEGVAVLKQLDALGVGDAERASVPAPTDLDERIEHAVARMRESQQRPADAHCHRCGAGVQPDDRFCAACGATLTAATEAAR